jgi:hypothetical protein
MIARVHKMITSSKPWLILFCVTEQLTLAQYLERNTVKKSIWITLVATILIPAFAQAGRAENNFYTGGPVEERAAMMSPEKTAYQEALRAEHQCVSEHQRDYSSACSKLFLATVRAQQNFGYFIATGEGAPRNRPVAAKTADLEQTEQEWPDNVIKAIVARNPYWTSAQKAEQIKLYMYSHSCTDCLQQQSADLHLDRWK